MTQLIKVSTDGSCLGNPGPGGYAAIIKWDDDLDRGDGELTVSGGAPSTTNNRMELSAVIESLRTINGLTVLQGIPVEVRSDSEYIIKAFNNCWIDGWKKRNWRNSKKEPVLNRDLWEELLAELEGREVLWTWVKGHAGDPMNERCDQLAVEQAQVARTEPGDWCSVGMPKSRAYSRNPEFAPQAQDWITDPPAVPAAPEAPTINAALDVIEALGALISECETYSEFRHRFSEFREQVRRQ